MQMTFLNAIRKVDIFFGKIGLKIAKFFGPKKLPKGLEEMLRRENITLNKNQRRALLTRLNLENTTRIDNTIASGLKLAQVNPTPDISDLFINGISNVRNIGFLENTSLRTILEKNINGNILAFKPDRHLNPRIISIADQYYRSKPLCIF